MNIFKINELEEQTGYSIEQLEERAFIYDVIKDFVDVEQETQDEFYIWHCLVGAYSKEWQKLWQSTNERFKNIQREWAIKEFNDRLNNPQERERAEKDLYYFCYDNYKDEVINHYKDLWL